LDFWFENKPSGNPGFVRGIFAFGRVLHFPDEEEINPLAEILNYWRNPLYPCQS
jgi:hypothetical protein